MAQDIPKKKSGKVMRVLRLGAFLLLPVYIGWSLFQGSCNPADWNMADRIAFAVLEFLWFMAWGCAALAALRRLRLAREYYGPGGAGYDETAAAQADASEAAEHTVLDDDRLNKG